MWKKSAWNLMLEWMSSLLHWKCYNNNCKSSLGMSRRIKNWNESKHVPLWRSGEDQAEEQTCWWERWWRPFHWRARGATSATEQPCVTPTGMYPEVLYRYSTGTYRTYVPVSCDQRKQPSPNFNCIQLALMWSQFPYCMRLKRGSPHWLNRAFRLRASD